MGTTIISTKGVDELVVMPRQEYDALIQKLEKAQELALVGTSRQNIAAGVEEIFDAGFAKTLLLSAEAPLKLWRDYRGLSQVNLSKRSGVRQAMISDIEHGKTLGTPQTLKKLAHELGCTIELLMPDKD